MVIWKRVVKETEVNKMNKAQWKACKIEEELSTLELVRQKALELNDTQKLNEWIIKEQEKVRNRIASET